MVLARELPAGFLQPRAESQEEPLQDIGGQGSFVGTFSHPHPTFNTVFVHPATHHLEGVEFSFREDDVVQDVHFGSCPEKKLAISNSFAGKTYVAAKHQLSKLFFLALLIRSEEVVSLAEHGAPFVCCPNHLRARRQNLVP